MLIGTKRHLAFELIPVEPSWERRYAPERAGWAGFAIWVEGTNLCQHVPPGAGEVHDYFFVPLGPIADWLVQAFSAIEFEERPARLAITRQLHQSAEHWAELAPPSGFEEDAWLDAREEWWARHFLQAGADGAYLPNLAFAREDEQLVLEWKPPYFRRTGIRLVTERGISTVPWSEGREALTGFVSQVANWLRAADSVDVFPWAAAEDPILEEANLARALELLAARSLDEQVGILGVRDLDELLTVLGLTEASTDPAASPLCQVMRDLSPGVTSDVGLALRELGTRLVDSDSGQNARLLDARRVAQDAARSGWSPEERGYLAATAVRSHLQLDGAPVPDIREAVARCGLAYEHEPVPSRHDRMMVGLREAGSARAVTVATPRTAEEWGRRFEAARALGHVLLDPLRAGSLGAASGPYAQPTRRRRSGAFAAEFLVPERALREVGGGHLDSATDEAVFASLLDRYGVGARTTAFHLWNHHLLSSESVRDELIETFRARA